jgi:glutathione reductase (NADPH)
VSFDFDLFVIGGGSGGVRCGRIAAGHGARVGVAESRFWGGTCVNVGCVPKKIMVQGAEYAGHFDDARGFGWNVTVGGHDWAMLQAAVQAETTRLSAIYARLLTNAGVKMFDAHAGFIDPHTLDVGGQRVTAERIVIATGGLPEKPGIPGEQHGMVSDALFSLPALPRRVAIMGGGYIAVEFAGLLAGLGAEVTLLYRGEKFLRGFDEDLRDGLAAAMAAGGIRLRFNTTATEIERVDPVTRLYLNDGATLEVDALFLCTGRRPHLAGLNLGAAGVVTTRGGAIQVDAGMATSAAHIFALGDVTDQLNLTPVATAQGHALADTLFGAKPRTVSLANVPTAVFSTPPMATVGLTEAEAAQRGPAEVYLTSFTPMRHTISKRARRTMMKLVVDEATQKVLGAHMLGEDAPEIMQGIGVALVAGATKADFDRTIGIHPTAAEEFVTLRTRTRKAQVMAASSSAHGAAQ